MKVEIDARETGLNIYKLREKAGMSITEMQNAFNFNTPQTIYKWQQGIRIPSVRHLMQLADLFGVSVEDILVVKEGCNGA